VCVCVCVCLFEREQNIKQNYNGILQTNCMCIIPKLRLVVWQNRQRHTPPKKTKAKLNFGSSGKFIPRTRRSTFIISPRPAAFPMTCTPLTWLTFSSPSDSSLQNTRDWPAFDSDVLLSLSLNKTKKMPSLLCPILFLSVLMTKLIHIFFAHDDFLFRGFLNVRTVATTSFDTISPIPRCVYPLIPPVLTYYVVPTNCMMTRFDLLFTIWLWLRTKTDWKPKLACTVVYVCVCFTQWDGRIHRRWRQTEGRDSDRLPRRCRCPGPRPSPCPTGNRSWNPGLRWAGLRFTYHSTLARRYPFRFHKDISVDDRILCEHDRENKQLYTQKLVGPQYR